MNAVAEDTAAIGLLLAAADGDPVTRAVTGWVNRYGPACAWRALRQANVCDHDRVSASTPRSLKVTAPVPAHTV